jgi:Tol biopolymer transport system component
VVVGIDLRERLDLDVSAAPRRWVTAAAFAIELTRVTRSGQQRFMVVADADTSELVLLPLSLLEEWEFRALSADGRCIVIDTHSDGAIGRFCLVDLATGDQRLLDVDPEVSEADVFASFSPDGGTLAMVHFTDGPTSSVSGGLSVVALVDIASGSTRRLFTSPGFVGFNCGVAWAPDGRHVAATYVAQDDAHPEGNFQTVVIDLEGQVIAHVPGHDVFLTPPDNSAWLDDGRLLCFGESGVAAMDVMAGEVGPLVADRELAARQGDRLVRVGGETALETTAVDGSDVRPWLDVSPSATAVTIRFADKCGSNDL